MEVVGEGVERAADLILRRTEHFGEDGAVGVGHQGVRKLDLVGTGGIGSRRVFTAGKRRVDAAVLRVDRNVGVEERKVGIDHGNVGTGNAAFSRYGTLHAVLTEISLLEDVAVNRDNRDAGAFGKVDLADLHILTGNHGVGTALVDRHVNRVAGISLGSQFTLHGEVVGIGFQNTERAAVDRDLAVGRSRAVFTGHTKGFGKAEQRAFLNGRAAAIGVVAREHKRAGAALRE